MPGQGLSTAARYRSAPCSLFNLEFPSPVKSLARMRLLPRPDSFDQLIFPYRGILSVNTHSDLSISWIFMDSRVEADRQIPVSDQTLGSDSFVGWTRFIRSSGLSLWTYSEREQRFAQLQLVGESVLQISLGFLDSRVFSESHAHVSGQVDCSSSLGQSSRCSSSVFSQTEMIVSTLDLTCSWRFSLSLSSAEPLSLSSPRGLTEHLRRYFLGQTSQLR
jgi:hypothetical protein